MISGCVKSSAKDPLAIYKNLTDSLFVSRSSPSAILLGIETAALRIWSLNPKSLLKNPVFVNLYMYTAIFSKPSTF